MAADGYNDYSVDADPFMIAIHRAILNDDPMELAQACQEDVDLDEKFTANINEMHIGMTPLALACALNKPRLAEVLLNSGADVNAPFATLNTTALMTSAFHGHVEIVRLLLGRGANVHLLDLQQSTALGYAFGGTRHTDVISLLIQAGVDVNQKNMLGMNALLLVAGYGNDELVQMVLSAGADPNATNDFGHTALHLAVVGKKDQTKKFRETGNPNSTNALNRRNLDIAMQEWARLHRDKVGPPGSQNAHDDALAKVGNFMMSIGEKLEEPPNSEEDEQEAMKRRVEAVWKHRQEKLDENKQKKKSSVMGTLLSCGGGKSKKVNKSNAPRAQPYVPSDTELPQTNDEVQAINERCAHVLSLLITAGCEIDKTESAFGMTALDMAVLNGDVESSAQLVSAGGDPDHLMKMFALSDLYEVLILRQKKELKDLLTFDEDLDINMPFSRFSITNKPSINQEESGDEGLTPISVAAKTEDIEIVTMLLKHGAEINGMGPAGRAAIHEGAGKGFTKMCGFLLQKGANPEAQATGYLNATPVTIAAIMRHHRVVELFISRGAKVDKTLLDQTNSLLKSAAQDDMEMVHILLSAKLQMNFIDPNGFMFNMASKYQSNEREMQAIMEEVHAQLSYLEEVEREKDRQRQIEEENKRRILPKPQPQPVQAPPQPVRPAPAMPVVPPNAQSDPRLQQAPPGAQYQPQEGEESEEEEESSEEEEEEEEVGGAPVTSEVVVNKPYEPQPVVQPPAQPVPVPVVQPAAVETNIDDDEEEEEEEETESEEEEESSEEEEEEPLPQAPPTPRQVQPTSGQAPPTPAADQPPPPLPDLPPPPPPAGPPPESDEEEEEEDEEEETSEEEEDDEEEEETSEEEEEEVTTTTSSQQVVKRTVTTQEVNGKTTTFTKTTVISKGQQQPAGPALANVEDMESEEEEETSEEEESEEEEESSEEEEEEPLPANQNAQNNNLSKPGMTSHNISHDNKETTI